MQVLRDANLVSPARRICAKLYSVQAFQKEPIARCRHNFAEAHATFVIVTGPFFT